MKFSEEDLKWMRLALSVAEKGRYGVLANPMVGAVFVRDGKVLSQGYHMKFGGKHAEIEAIDDAEADFNGATLYVTLEPCCFEGKTGACTDALVGLGLKRVVVGMSDPNPEVNGKGVEILENAGISVDVGCLEDEAVLLNQAFVKFVKTKIPYVTMKVAMSADGKIACRDGSSKWIASEMTRRFVHGLRAENQAILVGVGTVLADDPHLGVRDFEGDDPLRVVLDSELRTPLEAKVLRDENVVIFVGKNVELERLDLFREKGIEVVVCENGVEIDFVMKKIGEKGISKLLVEGGAGINGAFLEAGMIDKYIACVAPKLIGGSDAKSPIGGRGLAPISDVFTFERMEMRMSDKDVIIEGLKTIY